MKSDRLMLTLAAPLCDALTTTLHAQSSSASAFTYQGYLTSANQNPVSPS